MPTLRLLALILALTLVKLILTSVLPLWVMGGQHDDFLFLQLASNIKHFHWLGKYSDLTLCKGPGYPMFVAVMSALHIPLLAAQQLFYAFACGVVVFAVRPAIRSTCLLTVLFAFLLFNPAMFNTWTDMVAREGIYSSQCLLLAGCLMGMWLRLDSAWSVKWWGIAAGYALAAAWVTREEGPWLLPMVAIMLAGMMVLLFRNRREAGRLAYLRPAGWVVSVATGLILMVCAINWAAYGEFCVVEISERNFVDAMAAMQRVTPPEYLRMVPVTKAAREMIYRVSPTFASIRDVVEGADYPLWASFGQFMEELKGRDEIGGGWWIWYLRKEAAAKGVYQSADKAKTFWKQVAAEINEAVDSGRLPGGPERHSLYPVWRAEYWRLMEKWTPEMRRELFGMWRNDPVYRSDDRAFNHQSAAPENVVTLFGNFTHEATFASNEAIANEEWHRIKEDPRMVLLGWIHHGYALVSKALFLLTLMMGVAVAVIPRLRVRCGWIMLPVAAIMASAITRAVLLLFLHVSVFYAAVDPRYLGPVQTFLFLLEGVTMVGFVQGMIGIFRRHKE